MLNLLKTFFYAFKFIFSFLKDIFTKSSPGISGDNNQTLTALKTEISHDHSINKGDNNSIENSFNQTTVSNTYNNYLPTHNSSSSPSTQDDSIAVGIGALIIATLILIYINNFLIVQYLIPLKIFITLLTIICLTSYIHILTIYDKKRGNSILFISSFIFTIRNWYFAIFRFKRPSYLHVSLSFYKENIDYLLPLIQFLFTIPTMILLMYLYSKSVLYVTNKDYKKFNYLLISTFFMCVLLGIIYAQEVYSFFKSVYYSLGTHLMEVLK